jgi:hypothetical protein
LLSKTKAKFLIGKVKQIKFTNQKAISKNERIWKEQLSIEKIKKIKIKVRPHEQISKLAYIDFA